MRSRLGYLLFLLAFSIPLMPHRFNPYPNLDIQPVPIPGGDLVKGYGIINAFTRGAMIAARLALAAGPDGARPAVATRALQRA